MKPMYKGMAFSPMTVLAGDIDMSDTVIAVDDTSVFPAAPNYATIGTEEFAETLLYNAVVDDTLSGCVRGVEGTAREWKSGAPIARNFTAADYDTIVENISELDNRTAADALSPPAEGMYMWVALDGIAQWADLDFDVSLKERLDGK
jgi:hypothetical protein